MMRVGAKSQEIREKISASLWGLYYGQVTADNIINTLQNSDFRIQIRADSQDSRYVCG